MGIERVVATGVPILGGSAADNTVSGDWKLFDRQAVGAAHVLVTALFPSIGGADLDERMAAVAADLGLAVDLDLATSALSGGQAARVGLAALLLSRVRPLPARRADERPRRRRAGAARGLRRRSQRCGIVVVSHDREFLSRTVDRRRGDRPQPAAGHDATAAATTPTSTSAASPAGTRGRRTTTTPPARARLQARAAHAARVDGEGRAGTPAARRRTTTSRSAASGPRARRSRPPRRGRPTG